MAKAVVDVNKVLGNFTLTVHTKNVNLAKSRLRLAGLILRLGAWVGGFGGIEFNDDVSRRESTSRSDGVEISG